MQRAYRKNGEWYVLLFTGKTRAAALRQLGKWAANPEHPFGWYDAAVMSQAVRAAVEDECLPRSANDFRSPSRLG